MARHIRGVLAVVLCCAALAGCSTNPPEPSPYAAEFELALTPKLSEFQRAILSDHVITESEYAEARNSFLQCLLDAGIRAKLTEPRGYEVHGELSKQALAEDTRCNNEYLIEVESLYNEIRDNPENRGYYELAHACLLRKGIIGAETNEKMVQELLEEAYQDGFDGIVRMQFPSGATLNDDEVKNCYISPTATE